MFLYAFGSLILGWLLLFLQVIHVLPLSLFISFCGHGLSFIGTIVGLIAIVQRSEFRPKKY